MRNLFFILHSLLVLTVWVSCSKKNIKDVNKSDSSKPLVVTTTTMVTDLVKNIAGDELDIRGLMGPTIDPHLYTTKVSDNILLIKADIIFYSGLHLEGKMSVDLRNRAKKGHKIYSIGDSIDKKLLKYVNDNYSGGKHKIADPHIWGDVMIWLSAADYVYNNLSKNYPDKSDIFKKNYESYKSKLIKLDEWAKKQSLSIPKKNRIIISSHDAFEYFGSAYDFKVIGLQGISTVTEAAIKDILKTIDFIKENDVKAIFIETTTSAKAIKKIVESTGVKIGGKLFSDAMGELGKMENFNGETYDLGTYEGMIKHNINTVVSSLR